MTSVVQNILNDEYNDDGDDYYQRYLDDYYLDSLQGQGLAAPGQGLGPDPGPETAQTSRLGEGLAPGPGLDLSEGSEQELHRAKLKVARMILQLNLQRAQGPGLALESEQGPGLGHGQGLESGLFVSGGGLTASGGGLTASGGVGGVVGVL